MIKQFKRILAPERICCAAEADSKKRALQIASQQLVQGLEAINPIEVLEAFVTRERLGSTGIGHGVAIPHVRFAGIESTRAAFVQLQKGVDFEAADGQEVDLLFAMLMPDNSEDAQANIEHLEVLAVLAQLFNDEDFCREARERCDGETLYELFVNYPMASAQEAASTESNNNDSAV